MNFNQKVYELIKRIPKGRVSTYGVIAKKLGTKAYRAVGRTCATNPHAPQVPCHRVVMSSGFLGGYTAHGSKARLLEMEGIKIKNGKVDLKKYIFDFS